MSKSGDEYRVNTTVEGWLGERAGTKNRGMVEVRRRKGGCDGGWKDKRRGGRE